MCAVGADEPVAHYELVQHELVAQRGPVVQHGFVDDEFSRRQQDVLVQLVVLG